MSIYGGGGDVGGSGLAGRSSSTLSASFLLSLTTSSSSDPSLISLCRTVAAILCQANKKHFTTLATNLRIILIINHFINSSIFKKNVKGWDLMDA